MRGTSPALFAITASALLLLLLVSPSPPAAHAVERDAIDKAVDRGVAALRRLQQPGGTWRNNDMGATALAGLTLLECGVEKDDRAVKAAAAAVRKAALGSTHTYSLSLAVLFLDRLDQPSDTPLIESMIVRLLAGQSKTSGGWSYNTPPLAAEELRRVRDEMDNTRVLRGGRDLGKLPDKGRRTATDLPKEVQDQLLMINRAAPGAPGAPGMMDMLGDNSNTQFATLALWVGRRYGVPTQAALLRVGERFRRSQNRDGGWMYSPDVGTAPIPGLGNSTAAMTCAGLIGLACSHGAALDVKKAKDPKVDKQDISKDVSLKAGLLALSTAVGNPIGWNGQGLRPRAIASASGKAFYYLWSLERVAVILNLETINKKSWYQWGAELLLANQQADGTWKGDYADGGVDTCFALLFLKKANSARDLTGSLAGLKGHAIVMRAGGVGGGGLKGAAREPELTPSGIGDRPAASSRTGEDDSKKPTTPRPRPRNAEEAAAHKLSDALVKNKGEGRSTTLGKLRDTKGVAYTEALVSAIDRLDDTDARHEARYALAQRFTRMKDSTLRNYLEDEEREIRRAAALAVAARKSKALIPDLIQRLNDSEGMVQRAALAALKDMTDEDFGPGAGASAAERKRAMAAWQAWWKKQAARE